MAEWRIEVDPNHPEHPALVAPDDTSRALVRQHLDDLRDPKAQVADVDKVVREVWGLNPNEVLPQGLRQKGLESLREQASSLVEDEDGNLVYPSRDEQ